MSDVALIYPPTCDPTAPYLAVPMLCGFLRAHGVDVRAIDANVEAYDRMLRRAPMAALRERVLARLARLDRRPELAHVEKLAYVALWRARGEAEWVPERIEDAVAALRDEARFFDASEYDRATRTVDAALRVISAAHAPLEMSFTAYRTPFSLLTPEEIAADARPERDPFHAYATELADELAASGARVVGLSVVFPGQMQPAFSFAHALRARLGDRVHLTCGGPALTQLLLRMKDDAPRLARVLGPFDSAICYEGETALLGLVRAVLDGRSPAGIANVVVRGGTLAPGGPNEDLRALPAPDFDGLPLEKYLSPRLVLPYDPTRGCYWGVCTFCHYGLTEKGTAPYKERPVATAVEHLRALAERHGTRSFYFSQDSVAPKTLLKLADTLAESGLGIRWGTDLKPEKYLTAERAQRLAAGGALACALGVESAAPRVLALIDKGAPIETVTSVMGHLHGAGVAVEAMCFTDFPTETYREAMATVRYLGEHHDELALFILGQFDLTHGSIVAQQPARFGLRDTWQVAGDELGAGLFYEEARAPKRAGEVERLEESIAELSQRWRLRRYPWAGSLSTAHTLLHYERSGPGAFRDAARLPRAPLGAERTAAARFDVAAVATESAEDEARIWQTLVYQRRSVSRASYRELAAAVPPARPASGRIRYAVEQPPRSTGRRPSHAGSSAAVVRRPDW